MVINIQNKSSRQRHITCLDNGMVKAFDVEPGHSVEFTSDEELAEIECDGSVTLVPTIFEAKSFTLIDDKEILRSRRQADILYVIILIFICSLTILNLRGNLIILGVFLVIEALIVTGIYKILKSEQIGEVVFIER